MTSKFVFAGLLGCSLPLFGGQIFGTVTEGGKAIAAGSEVMVECGGEQAKGATDNFGAYRINAPKTGRCTLTLTYKGQKPTVTLASLAEPVSADFDLQVKDGKYTLVRR